jgi:alpha-glucoside transport system permease protein
MFALGLYLAYPVFETLRLSLTDRDAGGAFVGLANYAQMFGEAEVLGSHAQQHALAAHRARAFSTAFGLLAAHS